MPWIKDFKPATITFIAFLEISASIGLVGPSFIGYAYIITNYAAIGICILMVLAGIYQSRKYAYKALVLNIALFLLSMVVAFN